MKKSHWLLIGAIVVIAYLFYKGNLKLTTSTTAVPPASS